MSGLFAGRKEGPQGRNRSVNPIALRRRPTITEASLCIFLLIILLISVNYIIPSINYNSLYIASFCAMAIKLNLTYRNLHVLLIENN